MENILKTICEDPVDTEQLDGFSADEFFELAIRCEFKEDYEKALKFNINKKVLENDNFVVYRYTYKQ